MSCFHFRYQLTETVSDERAGGRAGGYLLLQLDLRVELCGARHADDGRAQVTDGLMSHRRQRRLLLASLLLRATVKVERHLVDAAVQSHHRRQRHPEVPDLQCARHHINLYLNLLHADKQIIIIPVKVGDNAMLTLSLYLSVCLCLSCLSGC